MTRCFLIARIAFGYWLKALKLFRSLQIEFGLLKLTEKKKKKQVTAITTCKRQNVNASCLFLLHIVRFKLFRKPWNI